MLCRRYYDVMASGVVPKVVLYVCKGYLSAMKPWLNVMEPKDLKWYKLPIFEAGDKRTDSEKKHWFRQKYEAAY